MAKKDSEKMNNEKGERDSTEDDKCLENGEADEKTNKTSSRIGTVAKGILANKYVLVLILLSVLLVVFFIIIVVLAVQVGYLSRSTAHQYCVTSECLNSESRIVSRLNASHYDACDDFWQYSCGGWIQKHPLPDNRGSWTVLDEVRDDINWKLRNLIDLVPHDVDIKEAEGKVKKFYTSCMDLTDIDYLSEQTFKLMITDLGGWSLLNTWSQQSWDRNTNIQKLQRYGVHPFFMISVEPDDLLPVSNIIKIRPNGLGLPGRNYYFDTDTKKYEDSYKLYMDNVARQLGATASDANRFAENMFHYEKRLAEVMPTPEELQNPSVLYKRMAIRDLTALTPTVPWLRLLQQKYPNSNLNELSEVAIYSENYFRELSTIMSSTDNGAMHHYLTWQLVTHYVPHLSTVYTKLANQFHQVLAGAENPMKMAEHRWEFCLRVTSKFFGHALGSMYVKRYFKHETKQEILAIADKILASFAGNLNSVPWLDDSKSTEVAREKVKVLLNLVGYPEFIKTQNMLDDYYNLLNVQNVNYLTNVQNAEKFLTTKEDDMLKLPSVDHSWSINAHDVNAVYNYAGNRLVVAAGLLHPLLFDPLTPQSIKYGSIGSLLGSYLFKTFDDKGIQYQQYGILSPWLLSRSSKIFWDESRCLKQNHTFPMSLEPVTNLTLGEAIADLGGLKYAYEAYKKYASKEDKKLPGLEINNDKLFFISYAQTMCQNIRQERIDASRHYSTSSPNEFRVTRALMQLPEFGKVFECSSSSKMERVKQCYMW